MVLTSVQLSKTPQVNATYKSACEGAKVIKVTMKTHTEREKLREYTYYYYDSLGPLYYAPFFSLSERERTVEFKKHRPTPQ